jgi:hypothetical protein
MRLKLNGDDSGGDPLHGLGDGIRPRQAFIWTLVPVMISIVFLTADDILLPSSPQFWQEANANILCHDYITAA